MRKLLFIALLLPASAFADYTIKGMSDVKEGIVILNDRVSKDTIAIRNGRFTFHGKIKQPMLGLIGLPGSIPASVILESGEITVSLKNGVCTVGGTAGNKKYQEVRDLTASYRAAVAVLQDSSMKAIGFEKRKWSAAIDSVEREKAKVTGKWVRSNTTYAGLVALLSTYRKETPGNLAFYLEKLKPFSTDANYQLIADYYKGMVKMEMGAPVPSFTLQDLNGNMVSLASFKGKYVLVDFWYHNCGFCRQMAPSLVKIYADLQKKGFEIVSISIDSKSLEKQWRQAIKEDGATWTELWDYDKTMPDQYGVAGYPTFFLLDKEGKLLEKIVGYQEEATFRKILGKYIL